MFVTVRVSEEVWEFGSDVLDNVFDRGHNDEGKLIRPKKVEKRILVGDRLVLVELAFDLGVLRVGEGQTEPIHSDLGLLVLIHVDDRKGPLSFRKASLRVVAGFLDEDFDVSRKPYNDGVHLARYHGRCANSHIDWASQLNCLDGR